MADKVPARKRRRTTTAPLHALLGAPPVVPPGAAATTQRRRAPPVELFESSAAIDKSFGKPPLRLSPPPCVAVALEVARAKAMTRLRGVLKTSCEEAGLQAPPQLAFERWRFAAKHAEELARGASLHSSKGKKKATWRSGGADALLPARPDLGDGGSLKSDLLRAGLDAVAAESVVSALGGACVVEVSRLERLAQRLDAPGSTAASPSSVAVSFHRASVELSCGPASFVTLTLAAYNKLCSLHRASAPHGEAAPPPPDGATDAEAASAAATAEVDQSGDSGARRLLHERVFALCLRYKTLHGHGFQAAAGPAVLAVLKSRLGVCFEAFASPLNARWAPHCSAFPDTDAPFGSLPSFFCLSPKRGCFEVNPPFVPCVLDAAARTVLALLSSAEASHSPLLFAFFAPGWAELACVGLLSASPFRRFRADVAAVDHGFVDGAAHQRRDVFRDSPFDTLVFVLATSKVPPFDATALEAELREAMAATRPSLAAQRRQGRAPPVAAALKAALPQRKKKRPAPREVAKS